MDQANLIIRNILDEFRREIRPGMTTMHLDRSAETRIRDAGGIPAFNGYPHSGDGRDFPGTICATVNDEIVHGIPSSKAVLREGDIVSVDRPVRDFHPA